MFMKISMKKKICLISLIIHKIQLHKTAQHGKFIRQKKRVSMLNAQILSTPLCFLFVLFLPNPPLAI